jgi:hypothetical protein
VITVDDITDDQIRAMLDAPEYLAAKATDRPPWRIQLHCIRMALEGSQIARGYCVDILNARAAKATP